MPPRHASSEDGGICTARRPSPPGACAPCSLRPLPFRILQPLSHLLVLLAVERPTLCSTVPAVVLDGHVDATVDEESHRLVVVLEHQMVQDARRLMGVPIGVDICAVRAGEGPRAEGTGETVNRR